jgi:hypothetical protein
MQASAGDCKFTLPDIQVDFWLDKNEYYSTRELSSEVRRGLNHASKAGLVTAVRPTFSSNADVVKEIVSRIQAKKAHATYTDEELLLIFDLIQGWGGAMGRWPYIYPKGKPHRLFFSGFCEIYRQGILLLFRMREYGVTTELVDAANKKICELPRVGESFSSKHLQFWSIGLDLSPKLAIFDTRIKQLMAGASKCKAGSISYISFLETLESEALQRGVRSEAYERALFAFSKNYFPNDSLKIKNSIEFAEDLDLAQSLAEQNTT